MLRHLRQPGVLLGVIAIVLACAGSATAGSLITGAKIKDGSITGRDVRNGSLAGRDVKNHSLTAKDIRRGGVTRAAIADSTATTLQATPVQATKVGASQPVDPKHWVTVTADCPAGQHALGGGGSLVNNPDYSMTRYSTPKLDETGAPVGWIVSVVNDTGPGGVAQPDSAVAYVICSP